MKLSKKSRYGFRALIDLMIHSREGQVTLASIAERNNISPQYLEQVFGGLRRGGIVNSVKGPNGGYMLAKEAEGITLAMVIEALEGTYLLEDENTSDGKDMIVATLQAVVVDGINRQNSAFLNHITLLDLRKDYEHRSGTVEDMYFI